jgi:hypothetical protein
MQSCGSGGSGDEKTMIFKMIDTFINQKKFKDFVKQNVAL